MSGREHERYTMTEPAGIDAEQPAYDLISLAVMVSDLLYAQQRDTATDLLRRRLRRAFEQGRLQGRREIRGDGSLGPNPWDRSGWNSARAYDSVDDDGAAS